MQPDSTATDFLFKLWPWLEANAKRLAYGVLMALIVVFIFSFYSYRQNKRETDAGVALSQAFVLGNGSQLADACLKVAADYSGTVAGERALLHGATALFAAGKYPDAQAQFQKFLDSYPNNASAPQAELGLAASLDAQGKMDLALNAYQLAGAQTSDLYTAALAKLAIARMDEAQGKADAAAPIYDEIARAFPNSSIGSEAEMRLMELKTKSASPVVSPVPVATPAPASAPVNTTAPFNLLH
jgi:predicted negative regulator of RcsB-dependent stress response